MQLITSYTTYLHTCYTTRSKQMCTCFVLLLTLIPDGTGPTKHVGELAPISLFTFLSGLIAWNSTLTYVVFSP